MQHEVVFALAFEGVDQLRIAGSAQRCNTDGLSFTTGKQ